MHRLLALAMMLLPCAIHAADKPNEEVKKLIDKLVEVDTTDIGYSGASSGSSFLPLNQRSVGVVLMSSSTPVGNSNILKELVKLGPKAVPLLLEHLSDARKTKLKMKFPIGFNIFISTDDEKAPKPDFFASYEYTMMVGDLCYVAIGQIVNRDYAAVRYIPSGNVGITSVPKTKKLIEKLRKEWVGLTIEKHRDNLIRDLMESDDYRAHETAAIRLGYYHPEAFEAAMLKYLARPTYDLHATEAFIRTKLYAVKTNDERKKLADDFIRKNGSLAAEGFKWLLFQDLAGQESDDRPARECLIAAFGLPETVKSKDRPKHEPLSAQDRVRLFDNLRYDRSEKLDLAVRDLLAKTDDLFIGYCLMKRLFGRGYDADIEAYLNRQIPKHSERDLESLEEYRSKLGSTRLHVAIELRGLELVRAAIAEKVDPNVKDRGGQTALLIAVMKGDPEIVELLLAAKADPNLKDAKGRLPVEIATEHLFPSVVRKLVAFKSEVPNVFVAAIADRPNDVARLAKAEPNCVKKRSVASDWNGQGGWSALHYAASQGNLATMKQLLALGAEVDALDESLSKDRKTTISSAITPLLFAVSDGRLDAVRLLLEAKANPNATIDGSKSTPLHLAARNGDVAMVKLLLKYKADRERKDSSDRTPLDLATDEKHEEVIKLLK